jgi:predicted methyltransferase
MIRKKFRRNLQIAGLACSLAVVLAPHWALAQTRTPTPAPGASARRNDRASVRREDWQRVPEIFSALGVKQGSRIADLGSGDGWLTVQLARAVGPAGRVFAVDISESALDRLRETVARDRIRNVDIVLAADDDPRLPPGTLDGVVILNAYHEVTKREPVLDGVRRALKPGGVLVIVDNFPTDSTWSREQQTARHGLSLGFARAELEAQGFEILSTDPKFIDRRDDGHRERQWMIVAKTPP